MNTNSKIEWTELRYPGNDPECGPARREPIGGCRNCGDKNSESYTEDGLCDFCNPNDSFNDELSQDLMVVAKGFRVSKPKQEDFQSVSHFIEAKAQWNLTMTMVGKEIKRQSLIFDESGFYAECEKTEESKKSDIIE